MTTTPPLGSEDVVAQASIVYRAVAREVFVRSWIETLYRETVLSAVTVASCWAQVIDEEGRVLRQVAGSVDPAGTEYVAFTIPAALAEEHNYVLRIKVAMDGVGLVAYSDRPMPTVR